MMRAYRGQPIFEVSDVMEILSDASKEDGKIRFMFDGKQYAITHAVIGSDGRVILSNSEIGSQ